MFQPSRPHDFCLKPTTLCFYGVKGVLGNMQMNGCGFMPRKLFFLYKMQPVGPSRPWAVVCQS